MPKPNKNYLENPLVYIQGVNCLYSFRRRSQNFKQIPQNFMKFFNADIVTLRSQIKRHTGKLTSQVKRL